MTINLLTKVPEGIVMISDSMLSASESTHGEVKEIRFEHARKMFHLGKTAPAAAMLSGHANIGDAQIGRLLRAASEDVDAHTQLDHTVCLTAVINRIAPVYDKFVTDERREAADWISDDPAALAKVNKRLQKAGKPAISVVTPDSVGVLGLTQNPEAVWWLEPPSMTVIAASYFGEAKATEIVWPGCNKRDLVNRSADIWWWGSGSTSLVRLIRGFDYALIAERADSDAHAKAALKYLKSNERRLRMPLSLEHMPIQQAVYLAEFLANVAVGYDRFSVGPRNVGGEMDVVVLLDGEFKWVHKQRLTSSLRELELAGWE